MSLRLVPDSAPENEDVSEELPRCKVCDTRMRPPGTTLADYPDTVPSWADNQCRICDYKACGKDPDDRFISIERIDYLNGVRTDIEADRRSRGVPAEGSRAGRIPITELLEK